MKVTILEPVTVAHYPQSQVCPMCKVEKEQNLKRHLIVWGVFTLRISFFKL